jgi:hypothetical protein
MKATPPLRGSKSSQAQRLRAMLTVAAVLVAMVASSTLATPAASAQGVEMISGPGGLNAAHFRLNSAMFAARRFW